MSHKKTKRSLGKGLSGMIRGASSRPRPHETQNKQPETKAGSAIEISIKDITSNPYQPREVFDHEKLEDLSVSIQSNGILQPLIVTKAEDGKYSLIAGERRLKAATMAALDTVPCIIRDADKKQMQEWAIIENIQRADLNPIEKARAYHDYINNFDATQKNISERLGVPRSSIANHLRLLELEEETQHLVASGFISFGHAKILASLSGPNKKLQIELAKLIVTKDMSVRDLEKKMVHLTQENEATETKEKSKNTKAPYIRDLENQLTETLGTRVKIKPGKKKNSGKILIEYYSLDDFDRLGAIFGVEAG